MAVSVSCSIKNGAKSTGQANHDLSVRPSYANEFFSPMNRVVFLNGDNQSDDLKDLIHRQSEDVKTFYNENKTGRSRWQKSMHTHQVGLISFGGDFFQIQDDVDKQKLDERAKEFFLGFCEKNHCRPSYLVRHEDEATTHYHFQIENLNRETVKPLRFQKKDLQEIQDSVAQTFAPMPLPHGNFFQRGKKKGVHFEEALKSHPQRENEPIKAWHKRVWRMTNTIQKSVRELHSSLPDEIFEARQRLNFLNDQQVGQTENLQTLQEKIEKTEALHERALAKLALAQNDENATRKNLEKLEKRAETYAERLANQRQELEKIDTLKAEIPQLEREIARKTKVFEEIEKRRSEAIREVENVDWKNLETPKPTTFTWLKSHKAKSIGHDEIESKKVRVYTPKAVAPVLDVLEAAKQAESAFRAKTKRIQEEVEAKHQERQNELNEYYAETLEPLLQQLSEESQVAVLVVKRSKYFPNYGAFIAHLKRNEGWLEMQNGTLMRHDEGAIFAKSQGEYDPKAIAQTLFSEALRTGDTSFTFSGSAEVLLELAEINEKSPKKLKISVDDDLRGKAIEILEERQKMAPRPPSAPPIGMPTPPPMRRKPKF